MFQFILPYSFLIDSFSLFFFCFILSCSTSLRFIPFGSVLFHSFHYIPLYSVSFSQIVSLRMFRDHIFAFLLFRQCSSLKKTAWGLSYWEPLLRIRKSVMGRLAKTCWERQSFTSSSWEVKFLLRNNQQIRMRERRWDAQRVEGRRSIFRASESSIKGERG